MRLIQIWGKAREIQLEKLVGRDDSSYMGLTTNSIDVLLDVHSWLSKKVADAQKSKTESAPKASGSELPVSADLGSANCKDFNSGATPRSRSHSSVDAESIQSTRE